MVLFSLFSRRRLAIGGDKCHVNSWRLFSCYLFSSCCLYVTYFAIIVTSLCCVISVLFLFFLALFSEGLCIGIELYSIDRGGDLLSSNDTYFFVPFLGCLFHWLGKLGEEWREWWEEEGSWY
jgi:hypothetical protein